LHRALHISASPFSSPLRSLHAPAPTIRYTLSLHDALPICSIALDSVYTPFGETADAPGGSAVFFSAAGAILHPVQVVDRAGGAEDRKSTRLNSSHGSHSYAVFCSKNKEEQLRGLQAAISPS